LLSENVSMFVVLGHLVDELCVPMPNFRVNAVAFPLGVGCDDDDDDAAAAAALRFFEGWVALADGCVAGNDPVEPLGVWSFEAPFCDVDEDDEADDEAAAVASSAAAGFLGPPRATSP
jgi:hypothetical protein